MKHPHRADQIPFPSGAAYQAIRTTGA